MSESDPIVLLAFPRTGSSMVARIFEKHGIFAGKDPEPTPRIPTGSVENLNMKTILKADYPLGIHMVKEFRPGYKKKILNAIKSEGYEGGPWLAKHAAVYWPIWDEFEPKFVNIIRNYKSVIESNTKSGMAGRYGRDLVQAFETNLRQMETVHHLYGAPVVNSDEVMSGDYRGLEVALNYCGVEFDESIPEQVIVKKHWHHVV